MPACAVCGVEFTAPLRGSAKYCRKHKRSDSQQRADRRAKARGEDPEPKPRSEPDRGSLILRATRALLTARGDEDLAREILGVDDDTATWALTKARSTRADVLSGEPGAGLTLLHELHTQAALRGLESVGEMSGHSAAGSTKQIGDAIETANLAGKRVYARIVFVLPDPPTPNAEPSP